MPDLSQPGDIAIAQIRNSDDYLIVSGDRRRSVRVARVGCAVLVGISPERLKMKHVRTIAPELLYRPSLAHGKIEMCEEMHDPDRAPAAPLDGEIGG